jgi:hypothetical protein
MRIRLLTDRVGGSGFVQMAGDVIDLIEAEAFRMIRSGQAEQVDSELAAVGPEETRTANRQKKR